MYELNRLEAADSKPVAGEPPAPEYQLRVTEEMLDVFCNGYRNLAGVTLHRTAVRASLELMLWDEHTRARRATGSSSELRESFQVYGESFTGQVEAGTYAELEDAIEAAKPLGYFGESGEVRKLIRFIDPLTGEVRSAERLIIGRRMDPSTITFKDPAGEMRVGFMDLREFEYGTRSIHKGPLRLYPGGEGFAVPAGEHINPIEARGVRELLLQFRSLVGVWRFAGDTEGWRGEFTGSTDEELDRWLPRRAYTDDSN